MTQPNKTWEDFDNFIDKIWSRGHIPDFADDVKSAIKRHVGVILQDEIQFREKAVQAERERVLEIGEGMKKRNPFSEIQRGRFSDTYQKAISDYQERIEKE